jgi:hypothetical protein
MSEISFRGVISVATTVGPSLLFVILHISQDPSIADNRKVFIFVISKEMEILGLHVSTSTA